MLGWNVCFLSSFQTCNEHLDVYGRRCTWHRNRWTGHKTFLIVPTQWFKVHVKRLKLQQYLSYKKQLYCLSFSSCCVYKKGMILTQDLPILFFVFCEEHLVLIFPTIDLCLKMCAWLKDVLVMLNQWKVRQKVYLWWPQGRWVGALVAEWSLPGEAWLQPGPEPALRRTGITEMWRKF